jgi:hypothetical protein
MRVYGYQSGVHCAIQFDSETCDRAESAIAPAVLAPRLVQIGYLEPVAADRLGFQGITVLGWPLTATSAFEPTGSTLAPLGATGLSSIPGIFSDA